MSLYDPRNRKELFLKGVLDGNGDSLPDPRNREEIYLKAIAEHSSKYYGSPLTAATAAGMTDKERVYVYTGSEAGYTAGNWYYWNGSAWVSGGVYNAVVVVTDTSLTQSGVPADAKVTGDRITELDDILEQKTRTGTATHPGGTGTRTTLIDGITLKSGVSYTMVLTLPSTVGSTVYGYLKDANNNNIATVSISSGNTTAQRTFTASNDFSGCVLSFTVSTANITATGRITDNSLVFDNAIERIDSVITKIPIKSTVATTSGNIAAGGTLTLSGRSAIKDGQEIVFKANISSFNKIRLDFTGGYSDNYVEFDATNIIVKNSSATAGTTAHGLTIANEVTLLIRLMNSHALIDLTSGGSTYSADLAWNQTGAAVTEYKITSTGTVCSNAVLTSVYTAVRRPIWYFGDSYIAFGTNTRIPYYVNEYGYGNNILFSGASGGTSGSTNIAYATLLDHGRPELAVFATGMNDGSDTASDPSSSWLSAITTFINTCIAEGITPVLCTVPTVPTVNNEQKNTWVRNSGYRFIDYADAVGASSSGVWYTGMLSSDNIHPSATGGNALFTQLLKDLPEIMGI